MVAFASTLFVANLLEHAALAVIASLFLLRNAQIPTVITLAMARCAQMLIAHPAQQILMTMAK
jgi:hypothetical protein